MARGGKRTGTVGKVYENRIDLNGVKPPTVAFQGQDYGVQAQQVRQQQAAPTPSAAAVASPVSAPVQPPTPWDAPTSRPNEPLHTGLTSGPGAGPEILGIQPDDSLAALRAIYAQYPNPDLLRIILETES